MPIFKHPQNKQIFQQTEKKRFVVFCHNYLFKTKRRQIFQPIIQCLLVIFYTFLFFRRHSILCPAMGTVYQVEPYWNPLLTTTLYICQTLCIHNVHLYMILVVYVITRIPCFFWKPRMVSMGASMRGTLRHAEGSMICRIQPKLHTIGRWLQHCA